MRVTNVANVATMAGALLLGGVTVAGAQGGQSACGSLPSHADLKAALTAARNQAPGF
jgi:hypothetical protein